MAITLRGTKGSPLTHEEMDENFTTLESDVDSKEDKANLKDGAYADFGSGQGDVVEGNDPRVVKALQSDNDLSDLNDIQVAKFNIGLDNVDNTADLDKPISTATQNALNKKNTEGTNGAETRTNDENDGRFVKKSDAKGAAYKDVGTGPDELIESGRIKQLSGDSQTDLISQGGITIIVRDTLRDSVEAASGGRQTVLYTTKNQPSYVTIIPKYTLDSLNAGLGSGVHPGFIVNGVEKTELFVGTYQGRVVNDELLSLPGVDPTASQNFDWFVQKARAAGTGWHCITNAEWSAIALWCWKNGFMPNGNNNYGRDHADTWETGRRQDGGVPGDANGTARTLTGSGPVSWRHDGTFAGISDLNGNIWEWSPGIRLVDGEIQIIKDNDAALNSTDFGVSSSAWKAIRASDGALVNPGTSGTLKIDASGANGAGGNILSTSITSRSGTVGNNDNTNGTSQPLEDMGLASGVSAPAIAKILGFYPVGAGLAGDRLYMRNHGERLAIRGGRWGNAANAGVFALGLHNPRSHSDASIGSRPVFCNL